MLDFIFSRLILFLSGGSAQGGWVTSSLVIATLSSFTFTIRWVGAWWLGYVIIGSLNVIFAIPLLFFPKNLPEEIISEKQMDDVDGILNGNLSIDYIGNYRDSYNRPQSPTRIAQTMFPQNAKFIFICVCVFPIKECKTGLKR